MTADEWNALYPVGTPVLAYPGIRPEHPVAVAYRNAAEAGRTLRNEPDPCKRLETTTRTLAWTLGHGEPVVSVDGYGGGIALTHIDPATQVEVDLARLRESLPLTDPDRHDLDTEADTVFAQLAASWGGTR